MVMRASIRLHPLPPPAASIPTPPLASLNTNDPADRPATLCHLHLSPASDAYTRLGWRSRDTTTASGSPRSPPFPPRPVAPDSSQQMKVKALRVAPRRVRGQGQAHTGPPAGPRPRCAAAVTQLPLAARASETASPAPAARLPSAGNDGVLLFFF